LGIGDVIDGEDVMVSPPGEKCEWCKVGGCSIYTEPNRPDQCHEFKCGWLLGVASMEARPDRSGIIIGTTTDGKAVVIHVDQRRRNAWRGKWLVKIANQAAFNGRKVFVVSGPDRFILNPDGSTSPAPNLKNEIEVV